MNNIKKIQSYLETQILGQESLVERLLIALLSDGHILVEGAPGLAKTRAVRALSQVIEGAFHRIQFTADLLPADITGTDIFRPQDASFVFQQGPVFNNFLLADEINRAPAKVQAALLEAMGERQITVGNKTMELPSPFLVMATQNPIEQEGTYPLPEAQLDRFLIHVLVDFPHYSAEKKILTLSRLEANSSQKTAHPVETLLTQFELKQIRDEVLNIYMAEDVEDYLVALIQATRTPEKYSKQLDEWIEFGASPRATIGLDRAARARAYLQGRDYVTPEDLQNLLPDILRHRLILKYQAEATGVTTGDAITEIIKLVPAP